MYPEAELSFTSDKVHVHDATGSVKASSLDVDLEESAHEQHLVVSDVLARQALQTSNFLSDF